MKKKIFIVHKYLEDKDANDTNYPKNHLWGIDFLSLHYDVEHIRSDSSSILGKFGRFLDSITRNKISEFAIDLQLIFKVRKSDLIYLVNGRLVLLPTLKRLNLIKSRCVKWVYLPIDKPDIMSRKIRDLYKCSYLFSAYEGFLCLTKKTEETYQEYYPNSLSKYIPWHTDLELFTPQHNTSDEFFFASGTTCRDYNTLIKAFQQVPYKLVLIAYRDSINVEIPDNVEIIEKSDDPPDEAVTYLKLREFYSQSIAVLIPLFASTYDTSGYTNFLEAIAMGKPVIKTKQGALDLNIEERNIGLSPRPNDAIDWVHCLNYIVENNTIRKRMGLNARKIAENFYSPESFNNNLFNFIKRF